MPAGSAAEPLRFVDGRLPLSAECFALGFEPGGFAAERLLVQIKLGQLALDGEHAGLGVGRSLMILSQLLPAFHERSLAFRLLLAEAPHLRSKVVKLLFAARQTELDGHRLAAARLTVGVQMVNASRILQQSCFGQCELCLDFLQSRVHRTARGNHRLTLLQGRSRFGGRRLVLLVELPAAIARRY